MGSITRTSGTLAQTYAYTGREYDTGSGLYHYRARAYDLVAGVFLLVDPMEFESDLFNLQAYVEGNPINFGDPLGMTSS